MPTYEIWYDEQVSGKIYFDADNKEHAQELLDEMSEPDDLPNFSRKEKGYSLDFDYGTLEEI